MIPLRFHLSLRPVPSWQRVSLWDKDWKNDDDLLGSETLIPLDRPSREGDVAQVVMRGPAPPTHAPGWHSPRLTPHAILVVST